MATENIEVPPDPSRTAEGLKNTGYSFNTAIADLVDNSISALATMILIDAHMDYRGTIYLTVADNGEGMDRESLIQSMKYGSPSKPSKLSLGKFGMGLKTASTSFCRCLSVVTRSGGQKKPLKATWDLDHIAKVNRWELMLSDPIKWEVDLLDKIAPKKSGTIVIWEKVDRLLREYRDPGGKKAQENFGKKIDNLLEHLGMVFQRFLDPDDKREVQKIKILVNNKEVKFWDPFYIGISDLVASEVETVKNTKDKILGTFNARAFILPREDELSDEQLKLAKLSNDRQGIYIYRENRLILDADWLGMTIKEPHSSLLRVEFSFGAELDETLEVDIKKSRISLNDAIHQWLKDEFLPSPRREAQLRYRKGQRKKAVDASGGAHDSSNTTIRRNDAAIDKATVNVTDPRTGEVEITNEDGITPGVRITIAGAHKPGEVYVQPVPGIDDGLLWQPAIVEGHQAVQINTGHDFYRKVYMPNILSDPSSTATIQGLDSLLWALAISELKATNENTKDHFSELRMSVSFILRKLVANLPEPPEAKESVDE